MDVFSLGRVLHFVMTDGRHPFGSTTFTRQKNILENNLTFIVNYDNVSATCSMKATIMTMIRLMIDLRPENRPKIQDVHNSFTTRDISTTEQINAADCSDTRFDIFFIHNFQTLKTSVCK